MLRLTISVVLLTAGLSAQNAANQFDAAIFKAPPAEYRGHAMWNFNLPTLNESEVINGIQEMAKLNYGGFFIEAGGRPQPGQGVAFLSDEYFRLYKVALEEARKQGLEVILYDDYAFPTGTAGGQMASKFPQYVAKNLNMAEKHVALKQVLPQRDVDIQEPMGALRRGNEYEGALTYIHKVKNDHDIYFFANSSSKAIDTKVVLRGKKALRIWNPHTGGQEAAELTESEANGQPVTTVRLVLPAVSSLFFIQE